MSPAISAPVHVTRFSLVTSRKRAASRLYGLQGRRAPSAFPVGCKTLIYRSDGAVSSRPSQRGTCIAAVTFARERSSRSIEESAAQLPATASLLSLVGLIGLVVLLGSISLRVLARRRS
jgi:hypothetical protein